MSWRDIGNDPDYRFSLANERTFLAWIRTALAILAGSLLIHQFASDIEPGWINLVVCASLAGLSAVLGIGAYVRWKANELAMRLGQGLPRSFLIPLLAVALGVLGLAAVLILAAL